MSISQSPRRASTLFLWLVVFSLSVSDRSIVFAFVNPATLIQLQSTSSTPTASTGTHLYIFDTIKSLGNIPPSQPILDGKKELLNDILTGTFLEKNLGGGVQCVYKASKDGWSAADFHRRVDGRGSALAVALSRTGVLFGGYNPSGWSGTDDYYLSNNAFLWYAKSGIGGEKAVKCPIYPGGNAAVYDYATGGPCFGSADLIIGEPRAAVMGGFTGPDMEDVSSNAGNLKSGRCSFSGAYDFGSGWPIRGNFGLVEFEVYCNDSAGGNRRKGLFW